MVLFLPSKQNHYSNICEGFWLTLPSSSSKFDHSVHWLVEFVCLMHQPKTIHLHWLAASVQHHNLCLWNCTFGQKSKLRTHYLKHKKLFKRKNNFYFGFRLILCKWQYFLIGIPCFMMAAKMRNSSGVSKLTRSIHLSRQKLRPLNQSQSSNLCHGSLQDRK